MPRGGKREKAGRPKEAVKTHVIRVPLDVSKADAEAIPTIRDIAAYWRAEADANPDGARYHFLRAMLDELAQLGL